MARHPAYSPMATLRPPQVDRDDKKHIKRWQSTSRWEQGQGPDANREGGAPAAAPD